MGVFEGDDERSEVPRDAAGTAARECGGSSLVVAEATPVLEDRPDGTGWVLVIDGLNGGPGEGMELISALGSTGEGSTGGCGEKREATATRRK